MTINVDTGEIDKEFKLNRSYACCGCVNYYDESDTVCKRGCIHYPVYTSKYEKIKQLIRRNKYG